MTDRKLATVREISAVDPIPDADAIDVATVGGWKVVVRKGEFQPGDMVVYFEIDSLLPVHDGSPFEFLASRGVRKMLGDDGEEISGHVLKTAKLRGQVSQGLVLSLADLELVNASGNLTVKLGEDVTDLLGIVKWEPPLPISSGEIIGPFPTVLARKSDVERVQNLVDVYDVLRAHPAGWIATEKVDGSSMTVARDQDSEVYIASRNWRVADDGTNLYSRANALHSLSGRLRPGEALQAEVYGEGIQGNPLKVRGLQVALFGFFRHRSPLPVEVWPENFGSQAVPEYQISLPETVEELIEMVDGIESLVSPGRKAEGVVFHTRDGARLDELDGRSCLKVISNKYLLKHGG